MTSRVTFGQATTDILQEIQLNYAKIMNLQQQLSTGKRINKPSDDPVGAAEDLQVRTQLAQNTQYTRNISDGSAYLATIDTTLNGNNQLIQNTQQLALQGATGTLTALNRASIAQQVRSNLDQMVAVANTTYQGDYVFSGTNTQAPPFTEQDGSAQITAAQLTAGTIGQPIQLVDTKVTDSADSPSGAANAYDVIPGTLSINGLQEGTDYTVDYVKGTITFLPPGTAALAAVGGGNLQVGFSWIRRNEADLDGAINRSVAQNQTAQINTTASDAYGSGSDAQGNTFAAVINLLAGLNNNNSTQIEDSVDPLSAALNRNLAAQAQNGARVNALTAAQNRGATQNTNLTDQQSNLEDVDFAAATSQLALQQSVFTATLQMGAQSIQHTLMDFL